MKTMSIKDYEKVLDMLENDKKAFEKLTKSEKFEISHDACAMKIAAATNIFNLKYLPKEQRQNKKYMCEMINDVNPLAMAYCDNKWFQNANFVKFLKNAAAKQAKIYNNPKINTLYTKLIDHQIQKSTNLEK